MNTKTLKLAIWKKVIGNEAILKHNHYYESIRDAIFYETGYIVNRDTVRNFLEDRNRPSPRMLDIYATFVLGGTRDEPKTFYDFKQWSKSAQNGIVSERQRL